MYSELPALPGAVPLNLAPAGAGHRVSVVERGSFAYASCTCGWFAPGRRSRDRARRDASEHLGEGQG